MCMCCMYVHMSSCRAPLPLPPRPLPTTKCFHFHQVVELLTGILRNNSAQNTDSEVSTYAYKLDECMDWENWFEPIDDMLGVVSNLTGPTAPHYYMFVRRADLSMQLPTHSKTDIPIEDFPPAFPRSPDDVLVIVKNRLSDDEVTQVMAVVPACMAAHTADAPTQILQRNPIDADMQRKINTVVPQLRARNLISREAADYLVGWANGTLLKHGKPEYPWLKHRWKNVEGQPEVALSDTSNVDILRQMKKIRCNWKVRGSELNLCSHLFVIWHPAVIHDTLRSLYIFSAWWSYTSPCN